MGMKLDLEQDEELIEFIEHIQKEVENYKGLKDYSFVLFVNDNPKYQEVTKGLRVKPIGPDNMVSHLMDQYCPNNCGCKLKTDGNFIWCSGVFCNYIGKEETF